MSIILLQIAGNFSIYKFFKRIFGIDANTSATIIITVLIFFLGYFLNSLAKSYSEYLIRKRVRKVFIVNLTQLEKALKNRQEILIEQVLYLETVPNKVYMGGVHFYSIEVLREIGFKNSFECFLSGWENLISGRKSSILKQKAFNKVWNIVSIIEYWDKTSKEDVLSFQKAMNEMLEKITPSSNLLRTTIDKFLASVPIQPTSQKEMEFKNLLRNVIDNWRNHSKNINDITEVNLRVHYLEPLKALTLQFKDLKEARYIYEIVNDMFYWNNNIKNISDAFKQQLGALAWYMRYCNRTCNKIIKILK